jgi:positive regulator of sigma E activity
MNECNSGMAQMIEHTGIINKIEDNLIRVLIVQQSACSECHAKGSCTVADKMEKIIDVESTDRTFKTGDKVILFGRQSIGLQAVLLVFVFPFVLILITLIILQSFVANEAISGALALLVLIPYYGILSFFNKRIKAKFRFEIRKDLMN